MAFVKSYLIHTENTPVGFGNLFVGTQFSFNCIFVKLHFILSYIENIWWNDGPALCIHSILELCKIAPSDCKCSVPSFNMDGGCWLVTQACSKLFGIGLEYGNFFLGLSSCLDCCSLKNSTSCDQSRPGIDGNSSSSGFSEICTS